MRIRTASRCATNSEPAVRLDLLRSIGELRVECRKCHFKNLEEVRFCVVGTCGTTELTWPAPSRRLQFHDCIEMERSAGGWYSSQRRQDADSSILALCDRPNVHCPVVAEARRFRHGRGQRLVREVCIVLRRNARVGVPNRERAIFSKHRD
jgi:hypothetical protein